MKYLKYLLLSLSLLSSSFAQIPEEKLKQGQQYLDNQQYTEARDIYEDLVKADFNNYKAHFGLGLSLFHLEDFNAARFEFLQLTQLDPKEMAGFYNLGVVQARQALYDEASASWQKAYEVGKAAKATPESLLNVLTPLGEMQMQREQYDAAFKTYQAALELDSKNPKWMLLAAQSLHKRSQGDKKSIADAAMALNYAYEALKLDAQNPEIISTIADIYAAQSLTDRALREVERGQIAIQDPESQSVLLGKKGELLASQGKVKEAIIAYAAASNRSPNDDYQYALLLMQDERYVDAVSIFKELILQLRTPELIVSYAQAWEGSGEYMRAFYTADAAIKIKPEGYILNQATLVAGRALYRAKRYDLAQSTLATIKNPTAEILVWQGLASYGMKNFAAAQKAFEGAIALEPKNVVAASNLGATYVAQSRYAQAEALLRMVTKAEEKNAESWFNLGLALRALNKPAEAKSAFQKALSLGYTRAQKVALL